MPPVTAVKSPGDLALPAAVLQVDLYGLVHRRLDAHDQIRAVALVDHRVVHGHRIAVVVADRGGGGAAGRVEAEMIRQAGQRDGEGLVVLEIVVVDRIHRKTRRGLVRGGRFRQGNERARVFPVVVARGRGAVAGSRR